MVLKRRRVELYRADRSKRKSVNCSGLPSVCSKIAVDSGIAYWLNTILVMMQVA